MALSTEAKLLTDLNLQSRVVMAILHTSSNVINEAPDTPDHEARLALAKAALSNPTLYQAQMYNYIIIQPGIVEHGADSTVIEDQVILDAVSSVWNTFATQIFPPAIPGPGMIR